ncbi:MAG: BatA domain-containing protein [Longimicrobiales bacterium]|nr:BatA domain-containing protein [Longimicrobiales bacterium]
MPFAFLAPVFLAGLAALAVPVLIHLSSRPRKRTVEFPSLMFLERVEYRDASRRRLRHVLLFALRALALVLVAAAFARPFLDRSDAVAATPDGGREVVVLLDRSASMAVDGRMAEARDAVAAIADGLRRGDRATLVVFDRDATAVNRATDQSATLRSAADTVTAGDGATRLGPALRLASSILSGSPLPRRELVVISDFQRTAWDADAAGRMPAGTGIRMRAVGDPAANTFVADVRFGRERFSGRERVRVAATIAHRAAGGGTGVGGAGIGDAGRAAPRDGIGPAGEDGAGAVQVPVTLILDGRRIATRSVPVPVGGAATVELDPVTLPDRSVRGTVRVGEDALEADNALHFVLNAGRSLRVLVVEPRTGGGTPYLERALGVGPDHDVTSVDAGRLADVELTGYDVVVLNGADPVEPDRLGAFVRAGGGLVIVLGERSRAATWSGTGLLPGTLRGTRDADGAALTVLRPEHPLFAPFRAGAVTGARFYRYRELDADEDADVLARFGAGPPALVAAAAGRGRVLVLASPLDGTWNDLVLQPAFVPLTHQLIRHASGREPGPAWRTVGDLLDLGEYLAAVRGASGPAGAAPESGAGNGVAEAAGTAAVEQGSAAAGARRGPGDRPVVLTPSDEPVPVDAGTLLALWERGFYEVRDPRTGLAVPVAVNGTPSESELATVDPEVVETAISGGEAAAVASFAPEERERRQSLWWYFLVGAFVLMAAETVLSNGLSRRPVPVLKGGGE